MNYDNMPDILRNAGIFNGATVGRLLSLHRFIVGMPTELRMVGSLLIIILTKCALTTDITVFMEVLVVGDT